MLTINVYMFRHADWIALVPLLPHAGCHPWVSTRVYCAVVVDRMNGSERVKDHHRTLPLELE